MSEKVNIKVVVAAGVSPRDAIKAALPGTFADFARRHGFFQSNVSACVNGQTGYAKVRAALAAELGVEREWLDDLLDDPKPAGAESTEKVS